MYDSSLCSLSTNHPPTQLPNQQNKHQYFRRNSIFADKENLDFLQKQGISKKKKYKISVIFVQSLF